MRTVSARCFAIMRNFQKTGTFVITFYSMNISTATVGVALELLIRPDGPDWWPNYCSPGSSAVSKETKHANPIFNQRNWPPQLGDGLWALERAIEHHGEL